MHQGRRLRFCEGDGEQVEITDAHRIAFRRLVNAAVDLDDDDRFDISLGVFSGDPYELTPIVIEEIDLLLGNAALIATRLQDLATKPIDEKSPLAGIERMGAKSRLRGLMDSFVRWACIAAGKSGPDAIESVLAVLRGLPEGIDEPRATIVGQFHHLARTGEGLMQVLPDYYSALVGSSQVVRSDAATTLGEMPRATLESMPSLVFEAFCALLLDPYVIVHRAAVHALERFSLPEEFRNYAMRALSTWILWYAKSRNDDRFLVELIEMYAYRHVSEQGRAGTIGDRLLEIVTTISPEVVVSESHTGLSVLAKNSHYTRFFFRLLEDGRTMSIYHERLLEQFQERPPYNLYDERARAVEVGIKLAEFYPWSLTIFIEALTACGAWDEAAALASAVCAHIPDTIESKTRRLHFERFRIASAYEAAISARNTVELSNLAEQWRNILSEIRKGHEENKQGRDSFRGFLGSN